uniref:MITD1 C-terminal phospholipase D-like domain-containing protein n=1 Tax=Acrobeloides nanus TaxID=290746 RepID=A0A914CUJ1_9BILA
MIENRYLQRPWQYDLLDKLIEFFIDSTENFRSILVKYELSERTSEARQQLEFISWIEKKFNNQIVIKLEDMKKFPAMNEYHDRLFWFNNGYRVQIGLGLDLYEAKKYNKRERENPSLKVCKRTFVRYDYKKPD